MSTTISAPPKKRHLFMKFLGVIAGLIVLLLGFAATRPADIHVARSIVIDAPAADAYAVVNNQRRFQEWSPFAKLDPNIKVTYDGPKSGVGAAYRWSGDGNVGAGSCTIVESLPAERIRMRLDFERPFPGVSAAAFYFEPAGDKTPAEKTKVTWEMDGKCAYMAKVLGIFISMEQMIGNSFDDGLRTLKSIAEMGGPVKAN